MVQELYFSCLQKFELRCNKIQKALAPYHVLKGVLENENPTPIVVYAKNF